jgi:hypothetical protein
VPLPVSPTGFNSKRLGLGFNKTSSNFALNLTTYN